MLVAEEYGKVADENGTDCCWGVGDEDLVVAVDDDWARAWKWVAKNGNGERCRLLYHYEASVAQKNAPANGRRDQLDEEDTNAQTLLQVRIPRQLQAAVSWDEDIVAHSRCVVVAVPGVAGWGSKRAEQLKYVDDMDVALMEHIAAAVPSQPT